MNEAKKPSSDEIRGRFLTGLWVGVLVWGFAYGIIYVVDARGFFRSLAISILVTASILATLGSGAAYLSTRFGLEPMTDAFLDGVTTSADTLTLIYFIFYLHLLPT